MGLYYKNQESTFHLLSSFAFHLLLFLSLSPLPGKIDGNRPRKDNRWKQAEAGFEPSTSPAYTGA